MTTWLDETEEAAWVGLLRLTAQLQLTMNRQLTESRGISLSDYDVLVRLSAQPDGLRVRELQESLGWEQSRLSHHLTRMEKRDLVQRLDVVTDKRGCLLRLTTVGRAAIEQAAPSHVGFVRAAFLDHLSREQIEQLAAITADGLAALERPPSQGKLPPAA